MEKDVPYIVYESEAARHERTVKRLITALLISILLIVGSNLAWLWVWNQYDFSSESYSVETDDTINTNLLGANASVNGAINNEYEGGSEN
jgi:hypothetical protein